MRKLLISLICLLSFSTVAYAASLYGDYRGFPIAKLVMNGEEIQSPNVPPINVNGSVMVPLSTLKALGLSVTWDNDTKTVSVSDGRETPVPVNRTVKTEAEIQALDKAVAYIEELDDFGNVVSIGSGVVVNSKGLLLSAAHVAEINGVLCDLRVTVDGKVYHVKAGEHVFYDAEKDIFAAYLPGAQDTAFIPVNSDLPNKDDVVYTIGNPMGERNIMKSGTINAVFEGGIGTNIPVEGGDSGGALLNQHGELLGVITDDVVGGFGVPINDFKQAYAETFSP